MAMDRFAMAVQVNAIQSHPNLSMAIRTKPDQICFPNHSMQTNTKPSTIFDHPNQSRPEPYKTWLQIIPKNGWSDDGDDDDDDDDDGEDDDHDHDHFVASHYYLSDHHHRHDQYDLH